MKAKLRKLSDILIDLVRVIFVTFVVGYFVSPDLISLSKAIWAFMLSCILLVFAIMLIPAKDG